MGSLKDHSLQGSRSSVDPTDRKDFKSFSLTMRLAKTSLVTSRAVG